MKKQLNFLKRLLLHGLQDMADYQRTLAWEVEARLEAKCDALADLFAMDERGQSLKLGINRYYICI